MNPRPLRPPVADEVRIADQEPAAVEFLGAALPEHVRQFFAEQRDTDKPQ